MSLLRVMNALVRIAALAFGLMASGCATWWPGAAQPNARSDPPSSFATPLARGLPAAVGVYGIVQPAPAPGAAAASTETAVSGARKRAADRPPWADGEVRMRIGAGFFVSTDGLIVTAAHVVTDVPKIIVKLADQRVLPAELVAADEESDIALIRAATTLPDLPLTGNSRTLRPGDWVLAVGEPYGLHRTVVAGIVGGRGRHFAEDGELVFIQSDLALNPGNSGGPLLDMNGAIVGMNLRTVVGPYGSPGLSLSVPIEIVQQIVEELAGRRRIVRPRLGAAFEDVSPHSALVAGRAYASGALISAVGHDGVAASMGLLVGDIVVGMNGRAIGDSADLARALLNWRTTDRTRLVVFREGRYLQLVPR